MLTLFIDGDACPVKDEAYRVAARHGWQIVVVANSLHRVPAGAEMVLRRGFGGADDYIAETAGYGDVVVTADIPLAARVLANRAAVVDMRGRQITDADIGSLLAVRDLMETLRQSGQAGGGPPPMGPKDRSRFLATLDQVLVAAKKLTPPPAAAASPAPPPTPGTPPAADESPR